jgi:hypothetical protein
MTTRPNEKGCFRFKTNNNGSWQPWTVEPALTDVALVMIGALSSGVGRGPIFTTTVGINYREGYDPRAPKRLLRVSDYSITCALETGEPVHPIAREQFRDLISVHFSTRSTLPPLPTSFGKAGEVRQYELKTAGRPTCRVALAARGHLIEAARVDVLHSHGPAPTFDDWRAMDCFVRGLYASMGYTGIMRWDAESLYKPELLNGSDLSNGFYLNPLTKGFQIHQIDLAEGNRHD